MERLKCMKLIIKIYMLSMVVSFWAVPALAQILSLDSILNTIRTNNPTMQQYDQQIKAMQAYAEGAKAWMAPMIGAGTFMTPYPAQEVMEERDKGSLMFSIEQEVPTPSKLRAKQNYYGSRAAIEVSAQAHAFNNLRAEAKRAYYQWVVMEKKLNVLQENKKIMQTMKKLADIRYPYGQGSLGSIYKAQGRIHEVENMILMAEAGIEQKNIQLNTLMDIPAEIDYRIDTTVTLDPLLIAVDTTELANQRSDIQQIDQIIQSMRLNTRLMNLEAKPDFKIRFDHMSPLDDMMPNQFSLMGMMSIPIAPWSSKMYKSEVKSMNYEIEAMKKEREAMLSGMQGMLAGMAVEISSMQLQLENYEEKIIPALRKNHQTLMLAYEENNEELPMVIDAWETLNMAQMQYLDQLERYYLMIVDYEKELEK